MSEKELSVNKMLSIVREAGQFEDKGKFLKALETYLEDRSTGDVIIDLESRVPKLKKFHKQLSAKHSFKVGDIVKWKDNLKNRRRPKYNEPAIVLEILSEPIFDPSENTAGSPNFKEPLDILLGILNDEEEFIYYYFDSRRFQPYTEKA